MRGVRTDKPDNTVHTYTHTCAHVFVYLFVVHIHNVFGERFSHCFHFSIRFERQCFPSSILIHLVLFQCIYTHVHTHARTHTSNRTYVILPFSLPFDLHTNEIDIKQLQQKTIRHKRNNLYLHLPLYVACIANLKIQSKWIIFLCILWNLNTKKNKYSKIWISWNKNWKS